MTGEGGEGYVDMKKINKKKYILKGSGDGL
jgi:hypothetical protein